jgi:hypothetical protein
LSDDRRLHTGDGWQSVDATDDRRLHTEDGWDDRLHTGDGLQSGDADFKHLTNINHLQDHVTIETCAKLYVISYHL